jgi:hypothetical protein
MAETKAWENDSWSLALVVNLFHEYKLNVHIWDPVQYSEDVRLEILRDVPKATAKQIKEYDELCDIPTPVVVGTNAWHKQTYNTYQGHIWGVQNHTTDPLASDEKLLWSTNDSAIPYAELLEFVIEEIDEMMTDYALGKKDYKVYTEFITAMNTRLKARDARIKIKKIAKGKLLEATGTLEAENHIVYHDDTTKEIYDSATIQTGGWNYYGD